MTQPPAAELIATKGSDESMEVVCVEVARQWKSYMEYLGYKLDQYE